MRYILYSFCGLFIAALVPLNIGVADVNHTAPAQASLVLDMSLEDLLDVQITSVSKKPESLTDAAAAAFVISNEDLRRSGVTNIPDALRMVPGINVARIDANKWAVTSRGFNGRFANKLLVLVDGRTVYSPTFSGVYWETQDVILEDVERIEVIRGPGATVWGANAVNGVVNIITRHAADTQGGLVSVGGGSEERGFAIGRSGAKLGEGTYGRFFAKTVKRDAFVNPGGGNAGDDWRSLRGGFRLDSRATDRDSLTLQGELHRGDINQRLMLATIEPPFAVQVDDSADVAGGHLIARWEHTVSAVSNWMLQAYYDRFERDEFHLGEQRDTFDLDLTHRVAFDSGHDLVWGLGYRYTRDDLRGSSILIALPDGRRDQLFSAFLQDEITLVPKKLRLTLGSKFEHNDYSGFEVQPTARLAWALNPANKLWASVSRAVRTPSRTDHDFLLKAAVVPPFGSDINPTPLPLEVIASGNSDMASETLIAYELGYRTAPFHDLTLDLAAFYNDYDDLRTFSIGAPAFGSPPTYIVAPAVFSNGVRGRTLGAELAAVWQATDRLRLDLAYSYIDADVDWVDNRDTAQNTAAPRHQLSLRSSVDITTDLDFDVWFRYVDRTEVYSPMVSYDPIEIDDYLTLDIRLAWRPRKDLELSLVGQNLLNDKHLEYIQESFTLPTEVERGVYGRLELKF